MRRFDLDRDQQWLCSLCGGPVDFMGNLGDLTHGSCRHCGMWFSKPREENSEETCEELD